MANMDQPRGLWDEIGCSRKDNNTMTQPAQLPDSEGAAALGICESLLLALTDLKIINERDVRDLLSDVVTTNEEAAGASQTPQKHQAVVEIVQRILAGKDGMRSH